MTVTVEQIKAARALLNWTQQDLCVHAGLNIDQIRSFEAERTRSLDVKEAIERALVSQGMAFVDGGVVRQHVSSYVLNSYMDLLNDISLAMPNGGEILKHCADDRRSPSEIIERVAQMRRAGIRERLTISELCDVVHGNKEDYRKIPSDYFSSVEEVMVIYLNKVAISVGGKVLVIRNQNLTDFFKAQFEYWWHHGKKV